MWNSYRHPGLGLLVLRVVVGAVFVAHGAQKLFTYGFSGTAGAMGQMGLPLPEVSAALVIAAEFFGGILLIVGLLTRLVALALAFEMAVAIVQVHLRAGFFLPQGYEYALTLMAASAALVLAGPGAYALDNRLFARGRELTRA